MSVGPIGIRFSGAVGAGCSAGLFLSSWVRLGQGMSGSNAPMDVSVLRLWLGHPHDDVLRDHFIHALQRALGIALHAREDDLAEGF